MICFYLKEKINSKQFLPGQQLPTELELAAQFGVSRITAKKAFENLEKENLIYRRRGKGTFVSFPAAKSASSDMNKVISIIFPYSYIGGDYAMHYINGAMSYLASKGYYLSIHRTEGQAENERALLKELPNNGIGGIILYPSSNIQNVDILGAMCFDKYPIVTIDKYFEGIPLSYVVSDNFNGQYKLTEYMIKLGHRRIAYFANEDIGDKTSLRDRYLGYCKALKDNGIEMDYDLSLTGFNKEIKASTSEEKMHCLYKKKLNSLMELGTTAVLVENDQDAISLIRAANDMNIKVPKDISIAGFDDMELLKQLNINLTTVKQNLYEIGRKAAEVIVRIIEEGYEYRKEIVPTELIIRETTGCPIGNQV